MKAKQQNKQLLSWALGNDGKRPAFPLAKQLTEVLPGHLTGQPLTGMWRVALDGVTHIRPRGSRARQVPDDKADHA
jgi:hypothetical protein